MKKKARCIMIQGTSSNVGKSILAAGLCRLLKQEGYRVAPFKSQNMALNSYVTPEGGEIGRAQGAQAEAAGVPATVHMNPLLLKPKQDMVAQVIVRGKPLADMGASQYRQDYIPQALSIIEESLEILRRDFDVVVIEGAGSPAEVNLKDKDIANMKVALLAQAPVLLVADIDRGGIFASLIGTLELLSPEEQKTVAGFIINKFRGDISLLTPGLDFLEERTGLPVLGVVPFLPNLGIEDEDSVALNDKKAAAANKNYRFQPLDIAVVQLPRISNFTDFDPLQQEPDTALRYVTAPEELGSPDVIILPGTKNTMEDLKYLQEKGFYSLILEKTRGGTPLVGICGGFQMMGKEIKDPLAAEGSSRATCKGLGLFPLTTSFTREKYTRQVKAVALEHPYWEDISGMELRGYEIHQGQSRLEGSPDLAYMKAGDRVIGAAGPGGCLLGTYLHDLFHNDMFRRFFLDRLRLRKGWEPLKEKRTYTAYARRQESYDALAENLRQSLDMKRIMQISGLGKM